MITVERLDDETFRVTVNLRTSTVHTVTVGAADYQRLTGGRAAPEDLVTASFRFLLEREPNTAILSAFEISEIGRYFPEYEAAMQAAFQEGGAPGGTEGGVRR